jgi:hypothetical protein
VTTPFKAKTCGGSRRRPLRAGIQKSRSVDGKQNRLWRAKG